MHYTLNSGVSTSTCTFKCEGCGGRFDRSRLYNYSTTYGLNIAKELEGSTIALDDCHSNDKPYSPLANTPENYVMINMVCSKKCYEIAPKTRYPTFYIWCISQGI